MLDARALGVFSDSGNKSVLYLFLKMLSVYFEIFRFVFSCVSHAKNSCCTWGKNDQRYERYDGFHSDHILCVLV